MKTTILLWLCVITVCSFCNLDFKSLGRHQWRCKAKLRQQEGYNVRPEEQMTVDMNDQIASQTGNLLDEAVSAGQEQDLNPQYAHCCCGKKCKGIRGSDGRYRVLGNRYQRYHVQRYRYQLLTRYRSILRYFVL